jgi:hypothetical protein
MYNFTLEFKKLSSIRVTNGGRSLSLVKLSLNDFTFQVLTNKGSSETTRGVFLTFFSISFLN